MPVFARNTLRRRLGQYHLRDTLVGTTTAITNGSTGSCALIDDTLANVAFSGEDLHVRNWLRVPSQTLRVASFNVASGALVTLQTSSYTVASGATYELHRLMSPADKDAALDQIIEAISFREEVPLASVKDAKFYALPGNIVRVLDMAFYSDPTHSLDRGRHRFDWWKPTTTGSRAEVWIEPSLDGTAQIIFDAIIHASLGAGDSATVNIPDEKWVLYGAESQCWEFLIKDAPGKERDAYLSNARRAALKFTQLAGRYSPQIDKKIRLDDPL